MQSFPRVRMNYEWYAVVLKKSKIPNIEWFLAKALLENFEELEEQKKRTCERELIALEERIKSAQEASTNGELYKNLYL